MICNHFIKNLFEVCPISLLLLANKKFIMSYKEKRSKYMETHHESCSFCDSFDTVGTMRIIFLITVIANCFKI